MRPWEQIAFEIALRQALLLGGLCLGLAFAILYGGVFCYRRHGWFGACLRAIPTLAFAAAAFASFASMLVSAALALSALGDGVLSRSGRNALRVASAAFAGAHILYLLRLAMLAEVSYMPALLAGLLLVGAVVALRSLPPRAPEYRRHVQLHILLLTALGLASLFVPRPLVPVGALALGGAAALWAVVRLHPALRAVQKIPLALACWILYIAGHCLLLLETGFAQPYVYRLASLISGVVHFLTPATP